MVGFVLRGPDFNLKHDYNHLNQTKHTFNATKTKSHHILYVSNPYSAKRIILSTWHEVSEQLGFMGHVAYRQNGSAKQPNHETRTAQNSNIRLITALKKINNLSFHASNPWLVDNTKTGLTSWKEQQPPQCPNITFLWTMRFAGQRRFDAPLIAMLTPRQRLKVQSNRAKEILENK